MFCKDSTSSLSTGYRFYYWDYYKTVDSEYAERSGLDHSVYKVCELCVENKYDTFKEEIFNYKHFGLISVGAAMKKINNKASHYMQTQTARSIRSFVVSSNGNNPLHYGVNHLAPLGIQNLLSLILYTDFDRLSSHFLHYK